MGVLNVQRCKILFNITYFLLSDCKCVFKKELIVYKYFMSKISPFLSNFITKHHRTLYNV